MREYALVCAVSAAITYLLTPLARWTALRIGALAQVRDRDVHATPTPRLGGAAMYLGLVAGLLVAGELPALQAVRTQYNDTRAVLIAGGLIVALGVLDDRFGLDSLTKLAGQVVAAGVLVLQGVQLSYVVIPGRGAFSLDQSTSVCLTVLLVVVLVNAVNFVDGLDGLAAGVIGIAALASFAYTYQLSADFGTNRFVPATLFSAVLVGMCLGFLPHNFAPARLFMGDSGSMLLGLVLAAAMITTTGQVDFPSLTQAASLPLFVPLLVPAAVLAVPFLDLALAVIRRTRAGRSPFSPDKMHLHHRLLEIGHSQTRAVLLMYVWTALIGFGGVAISFSHGPLPLLGAGAALAVLAVVTLGGPRRRTPRSS